MKTDPMYHPHTRRIGITILATALLAGCTGVRDTEEARAAANIWHAAEAIDRGVDPAAPVRAIQAAAEAIAQSSGYQIDGIPDGAAVLPALTEEGGP